MQEAFGGQGDLPAGLGQDMEALAFEFQDDAAEDALFLEKFHNAAGFHVGKT